MRVGAAGGPVADARGSGPAWICTMRVSLCHIAHARSGDKGAAANIGVIARTPRAYAYLENILTPEAVAAFLDPNGKSQIANPKSPIVRYDLANLLAFNFLFPTALWPGGSLSL